MLKKFFLFSIFSFTVFFSFCSAKTYAAEMYLTPSSGSYNAGQIFSVNVMVNSSAQAMNAASGVITYPSNMLEVVSVSKAGSIISFWAEEPSNSSASGRINFEGVVLNPGYQGSAGRIITINLRARSPGSASLSFQSGSILANDGRGTNIASGLRGGQYTIVVGTTEPVPTNTTAVPSDGATTPSTFSAPRIISSSHPDTSKWYTENTAVFSWSAPSGTIGVRTLVSKSPTAVPTLNRSASTRSLTTDELEDGIWYFSVRLQNEAGWGTISRYRFQIDSEKPYDLKIEEIKNADQTYPVKQFKFEAKDDVSRIDKYEIEIKDHKESFEPVSDGIYSTKPLSAGEHTMIVRAYDMAGNFTVNSYSFKIDAITAPSFTEYPQSIRSGDDFIAKGITSYPNGKVIVYYTKDGGERKSVEAKLTSDGEFVFSPDDTWRNGNYTFWAVAQDIHGAVSLSSQNHVVSVKSPSFIEIAGIVIDYQTVLMFLLLVIVLLAGFIAWKVHSTHMYIYGHVLGMRKVEDKVHKSFNELRDEIKDQIADLDGVDDLSVREKKVYDNLVTALEVSEKFIMQDIKGSGATKVSKTTRRLRVNRK